jgi:hypothetical protein
MEIILEHVRSFASQQRIPLRPLTLLVGENSSGKSTFLAAVSCVLDGANYPFAPPFNSPPYNLGTFDTIATYKAGRYGRDDDFSLGFSVHGKADKLPREAIATYENVSGQVSLCRFLGSSEHGQLSLTLSGSSLSGSLKPIVGNGPQFAPIEFERDQLIDQLRRAPLPALTGFIIERIRPRFDDRRDMSRAIECLIHALQAALPPFGHCYSCAPIRSKPRRTYDELSEEYSPEGDHIPTLLARLLGQERSSPDAQRVTDALTEFGAESGLFKKVDVKRLGKKTSDPFQLQVAVAGPAVNLTDVGYGISQALPIIVQSVLKGAGPALLMQQPEVHLHPRAQAALGTFFAKFVASERNRMIVIETHSDYLVDRIRQEVATGGIDPSRVLILFFHKPALETTVSTITLDKLGNVENAPPEYREFFLKEELDLFNRTTL